MLDLIRPELDGEEFRRFFAGTAQASDSGDLITVWVTSESIRRHVSTHYQHSIDRALAALDRGDTEVRFVVSGTEEETDPYE